jgi:hypothetical protein
MAYQDLLKDTSARIENGNYFLITITDLNVNEVYPLQFRWKYNDGSFGDWGPSARINTPGASTPATPSALTVVGGAGFLTVTWDGKDASGNTMSNIQKLDIYIDGAPFDGSKPTESFTNAATKTITAPAGTYIVSAYAVSSSNTVSAFNAPVTRSVTAASKPPATSIQPSTPTVKSVVGAIQISWNGKDKDGNDQPYGFNAAKVYVGTSPSFTPTDANQVDKLNFANGQNVLNIGVGTVVDGTSLDYGINYYVQIATTNGTDTSSPVYAEGNPVQIGQVKPEDIFEVTADKITTGTLQSNSVITVGSTSGKHIKISGTGDPLTIYGSGGINAGAILSFNGSKLSIVGDGTFTGNLSIGSSNSIFKAEPLAGIWLGNSEYGNAPFSVSVNGVIKANSGTIGGWTLGSSYLQNSTQTFQINSVDSAMRIGPYGNGKHIKISAAYGIQHLNASGSESGSFSLSPEGDLKISGTITAGEFSAKGDTTAFSNNYWNETEFRVGNPNSYIRVAKALGSVILAAGEPAGITAEGLDDEEYVGGSKIVLDNVNGTQIYNLPLLKNGVTATEYIDGGGSVLSTQYRDSTKPWYQYTKGYGAVARQRMIVADPYDQNKLKRGFGVYYGQRNSAPGYSTGYVGDIWISWA